MKARRRISQYLELFGPDSRKMENRKRHRIVEMDNVTEVDTDAETENGKNDILVPCYRA